MTKVSLTIVTVTFLAASSASVGVSNAQGSAGHNHIGHVADAWNDTPDGEGLLPTALAEARIAARHGSLAAQDTSDLDAIKRHTQHVLHAVDPSAIESGPGLGYGIKRAAEGAAKHISAAAATEGASQAVTTHATHVATSAQNAVTRADEIVMLAGKIQETTSAADAAPLVEQLAALSQQLVDGNDANGDGRVGWQEGEGGLSQSELHLGLMKKAEGLP